MGKIISVWGSPGSGKTTFSIKLAKELASKKKNVIVVFSDNHCPVIPTLIQSDSNKSLGQVLSSASLTRNDVLENLMTIDKVYKIAVMGYKEYENYFSYPNYEPHRAKEFLNTIKFLADYIIIDTSSHFVDSILSTVSLEMADKVIRLNTSNLKSISYFNSSLSLLDNRFNKDSHINILSNFKESDPVEEIKDIYNIKAEFPYMDSIREQSICTELFFKLKVKEENKLNKNMKNILSLVDDEFLLDSNVKSQKPNSKDNIFSRFKLKVGGESE